MQFYLRLKSDQREGFYPYDRDPSIMPNLNISHLTPDFLNSFRDDVMAIKRPKRFIKGLAKLICKRFPKFCLNMYLGRNRMNTAVKPVNADESYFPPSNDIEGPDSVVYN